MYWHQHTQAVSPKSLSVGTQRSRKERWESLEQAFSNVGVPPGHLGSCENVRVCLSDKLPDVAGIAGLRTTLQEAKG